jgi:hypothetical protein
MVRQIQRPDTEMMALEKAEEMAQEQYERPFDFLTPKQQMDIWLEAEQDVTERMIGAAEMMLEMRREPERLPDKTLARCHRCHWEGTQDQLVTVYNPNPREPGDVIPELGCPACESDAIETL